MIRRRDMYRCDPADPPTNFLIFTALVDGLQITVKSTSSTTSRIIDYSVNRGRSWKTVTVNDSGVTIPVTINKGRHILFKGSNTPGQYATNWGTVTFTGNKWHNVSGNPLSIIYNGGEGPLVDHIFNRLFYGDSQLINAENLILNNLDLSTYCYYMMFHNADSLKTAPQLPATVMKKGCYSFMFWGCESLKESPELPATTLAESCYDSMFSGSGLEIAPQLQATILAPQCYDSMFQGCNSLIQTPRLPATTLQRQCYGSMFQQCSQLKTVTELPAITLADRCYDSMFYGCTSLENVPSILPATTLAERCYHGMFDSCENIQESPALPAITLVTDCYGYMFRGCSNLKHITAMFTTTPGSDYTNNWVQLVPGPDFNLGGTTCVFTKNRNATWNVSGSNGVPSNWTIQTIDPADLQT